MVQSTLIYPYKLVSIKFGRINEIPYYMYWSIFNAFIIDSIQPTVQINELLDKIQIGNFSIRTDWSIELLVP